MKSASIAFREQLYADNRNYLIKYVITLKSGTVLTVENDRVWNKGFSYTRAVSESGNFTIGATVIGKLTAIISNIYGDFDQYDFSGAKVVAYIGLSIPNGTKEYLNFGIFTVDDPKTTQTLINLTCYDNISKLDKKYVCHVSFPCTRLELIQDACTQSGIMLNTVAFNGYAESMAQFDTSMITCREIVSYVAQMGCLFVFCDEAGSLNLKWYDYTAADAITDGGSFSFTDGSNLDGGTFAFTDGSSAEGGSFTQKYAVIAGHSGNPTISIDDVVITGIRITAFTKYGDTSGADLITHLSGSEGYVLEITNNPLITNDNVIAVADYIYSRIAGLTFRPFTSTSLSDPCVEPGDAAYLLYKDGTAYKTFITSLTFSTGSYETFSCDAESPGKNTSTQYSASTKTAATAKQETDNTVTAYSLAMQRLTTLMANSFGAYQTEEIQPDGSIIYYMHNKPTLAASTKIWKRTIDAFAVSTDGGNTWNAGVDASGNIVANILSAIGINAGWINAGSIIIGGAQVNQDGSIKVYKTDGTLLFRVDKNLFIVNTTNFAIDENGNVTFKGDIVATSITAYRTYSIYYDGTKQSRIINTDTWDDSLRVLVIGSLDGLGGVNPYIEIRDTVTDSGKKISIRNAFFECSRSATFLNGIIVIGTSILDSINCTGNAFFGGTFQSQGVYDTTTTSAANINVSPMYYLKRSTSSSARYKVDIKPLEIDDIKHLYDLPIDSFKYIDGYVPEEDERYNTSMPGFIVEKIEEMYPIMIDHNEDGSPEMWNIKIMFPAALRLIQDLNDREIALQERVTELESIVQKLIEKVGGIDGD